MSTIKPATESRPSFSFPKWTAIGTATDIALAFLSLKMGLLRETLLVLKNYKVVAEWPFDSSAKSMTIVVKDVVCVLFSVHILRYRSFCLFRVALSSLRFLVLHCPNLVIFSA